MKKDGSGKIFNTLMKLARKYPYTQIYTVTREKIEFCDSVFQNETGKNRYNTSMFLTLKKMYKLVVYKKILSFS